MGRTKFNVDTKKDARTYNGITFASALEMKYYVEVILPGVERGDISKYELQKKYVLQDGFVYNEEKIRPIVYLADFYIEYADGSSEVVDTKGLPDPTAKLKRKLFLKKYPWVKYRWVVYIKKFGGWITYEDAQARRRDEKKSKNKRRDRNGKNC